MYIKKTIHKFLVTIGALVTFQVSGPLTQIGHCADIFAGGGDNTYTDIAGQDTYFGGSAITWDSGFPGPYFGDIKLTFQVQDLEKNNMHAFYGWTGTTRADTVDPVILEGNVTVNLFNTNSYIGIGGMRVIHGKAPMVINGNLFVHMKNSYIGNEFYGVVNTNTALKDGMCSVVGNLKILAEGTRVESFHLIGATKGAFEDNHVVIGDVDVEFRNATMKNFNATGSYFAKELERSGHIKGNCIFTLDNSSISTASITHRGNITGNCSIFLTNKSNISRICFSNGGFIDGAILCSVDSGSLITTVDLISPARVAHEVRFIVKNDGAIKTFRLYRSGNIYQDKGHFDHIVVDVLDKGRIDFCSMNPYKNHGIVDLFEVNLQESGTIKDLYIGLTEDDQTTFLGKGVISFIDGGSISKLIFQPYRLGESVLRFVKGTIQYPLHIEGGMPTTIEICKEATVHMEHANQPLQAQKNIQIDGTLNLTHNPAWTTSSIQAENIALTGTLVCAEEPSVPTIIQAANTLDLSGSIALTESSSVAAIIQADTIKVLDTFVFSQDSSLATTFQASTFHLAGAMSLIKPSCVETVVQAKNTHLGGTLTIPADAHLRITTEERFVADGAVISFETQDKPVFSVGPLMILDGAVSGGVEVYKPLTIQIGALDLAPFIESKKPIPIIKVDSQAFGRPDFFEPLRKGLVWGDMTFDPTTLTWGFVNIAPAPEYYGYTTGRKATSWLRENAMHMFGHRSAKALLDEHEGLWMDAQGGVEQLQSLLGTAGMFWAMASIGYDHHYRIPYYAFDIAHGISLGVAGSRTKLTELDVVRNTIATALANVYTGISHSTGAYSIIGLQAAAGRVENNNEGFEVNQQWTEIVPSGSFELGWKISISKDFALIPRVKGLVEYIPEQTLAFESFGTPETIVLSKSINANAIGGIGITYDLKRSARLDMLLCLDVDYIQGLMGSYGATSKVFSKEFVETNTDKVLRVSLGTDIQVIKEFCLGIHVFADVLDTKGIGGQLTAMYTF